MPSNQPPNFIGLIGLKIYINSRLPRNRKNITAEIHKTNIENDKENKPIQK